MHQRYALAGVAALLAAVTLLVSQPTAEAPAAPARASAPEARAPTAAAERFFRELGNADPGPPIEIALTDTQDLVADFALREIMDYYLLERSDAGRWQALLGHLRRTLPSAAAREAEQLAQSYRAYLAEHDTLLAAQNFHDQPDLGRLASWQQQQRQLRLRMLGARVSEEWFGSEDAYLTQALEEAGRPQAGPPASEDEARHREHMRQVLRDTVSGARPASRYSPQTLTN
ncbi:hypothetical protein [Duganella radicis]|uniref:Lipase modulator n=1 Tax=Duganella radicis TaxID=551988 RepID=A0A6L6PNR2_9BURK|nr:hypothetical protein [Duganella radicis]MTV39795.1 hypothetical protein [Duganella radicis]